MPTIKVLAHKASTAAFEVTADSRKDAEAAIAERLRSDSELIWNNDSDGINVDVIWDNNIWRPRARFFLVDDQSRKLLIEDNSEARPNGNGGQ
jgi:hypothetical protein